jgi:tRNA uridine 5-carboxymethylaminomethyl modification enzyme
MGVLVDDLITRGAPEPYRMFTSRAEYRLSLREDNADLRLTARGRDLKLVDDARWEFFQRKRAAVAAEIARLAGAVVHPADVDPKLLAKLGSPLSREAHAFDLLRRPELTYDDLQYAAPAFPGAAPYPAGEPAPSLFAAGDWRGDERLSEQVKLQVDVQAKYSGYLKRQGDEIDRHRRHEELRLPADIDYGQVSGLSNEARQCLSNVRPETLGQAARIPGLTPAAVSLLLVHLKKRDRAA